MPMGKKELEARLMEEAEAFIERLLAGEERPGEMTISDIEQVVMAAGRRFQEVASGSLVEALQAEGEVPQLRCPDCGGRGPGSSPQGPSQGRSLVPTAKTEPVPG